MLKEDVVVMLFQKKVDAIDASQQNRNVIDTTVSMLIEKQSLYRKMAFAEAIMYVRTYRVSTFKLVVMSILMLKIILQLSADISV